MHVLNCEGWKEKEKKNDGRVLDLWGSGQLVRPHLRFESTCQRRRGRADTQGAPALLAGQRSDVTAAEAWRRLEELLHVQPTHHLCERLIHNFLRRALIARDTKRRASPRSGVPASS
jgi:hypothetical protein